ncbi:MAG: DUF4159 domain-containing protein [Bacteroidota bacterium]|nr:DUF4159 domain-containing protein [Bacteroidota bacterium]
MKLRLILLLVFLGVGFNYDLHSQAKAVKIAKLKYNGGGDWYANPTALPNLISFCNKELKTNIAPQEDVVEAGSREIFNYPFIHMTGHGNVVFSPSEADNIRTYLLAGGFLHIDDNYGMDAYIRPEIKKIFPEIALVELPYAHPIYQQPYSFPNGLPKIHEHDNKPAQGFGIIYQGKLVLYYTYQTDLGDGWEDPEVHKDPPDLRLKSLQMGANMIQYVFMSN